MADASDIVVSVTARLDYRALANDLRLLADAIEAMSDPTLTRDKAPVEETRRS